MTTIRDLSTLLTLLTNGGAVAADHLFFFKDQRVGAAAAAATVAGRMTSLWQYNGTPSHGATPAAVTAPTQATDGGLKQVNPTGGRQKWLLGGEASANVAGTLVIYDRLLQIGGLNGTLATPQTVGGSLTRYTSSESIGNQIWVEVNTAIGATPTTITASYTDESGNSGQTSQAVAIGGTGLSEAQRLIPLTLAQGDTGVQAVASVTLAGTTGTAGDFGVVVARPLLTITLPVVAVGGIRNLLTDLPGITEIKNNACLAMAWLANGTTAPTLMGSIHMVEN